MKFWQIAINSIAKKSLICSRIICSNIEPCTYGTVPSIQCPAVRTWVESKSTPPQKWLPDVLCRETVKGQSVISASSPPIMNPALNEAEATEKQNEIKRIGSNVVFFLEIDNANLKSTLWNSGEKIAPHNVKMLLFKWSKNGLARFYYWLYMEVLWFQLPALDHILNFWTFFSCNAVE